ncbi:hypothetical protein [Fodinicola feengrottensis]|uniref:hypothetical protein n=1 Tax=Fodinicola feengrottensis TaxID=435914 RepID=UPI002443300A|nr:hypothetical protein [Fodinicola feengrottensis]
MEILRLAVSDSFGYANFIFVWLLIHQLGIMYANGQLGFLTPKRAAAVAAGAYATVAAMVTFGPYPVMMLALPGAWERRTRRHPRCACWPSASGCWRWRWPCGRLCWHWRRNDWWTGSSAPSVTG